jgi:hypothetical protein
MAPARARSTPYDRSTNLRPPFRACLVTIKRRTLNATQAWVVLKVAFPADNAAALEESLVDLANALFPHVACRDLEDVVLAYERSLS